MKKILVIFTILGIFVFASAGLDSPVWAAETKGSDSSEIEIPKWIKNTKFKGDFRLRWESLDSDDPEKETRNRWRIRWRFGTETKVNEKWKAGFMLASGEGGARSRNVTLSDTFQTSNVQLDQAYAQFDPHKYWRLKGGKFKNPIWRPKDLMWDSDITPEGIYAMLHKYKSGNFELFAPAAFFTLNEFKSTTDDPFLAFVQLGTKWKATDNSYLKFAGAYYGFNELTGNDLESSSGTNSRDADGNYIYNYACVSLDGEFGLNKMSDWLPFAAAFFQYVNSNADDDTQGYLVGLKVGHPKVKELWQWQLKWNYRNLERDAWPDFLPDSDFYAGQTDVKGNEVEFKMGLAKNVTIGLDYYWDNKPIKRDNPAVDYLQLDLVLKF